MKALAQIYDGDFFDPARFELVKWLAFAAMLCDHFAVFLGDGTGPLRDVGRFAFPAFALTFGIGLARSSDASAAIERLIVPGVLAEVAWFVSGHGTGGNVLIGFALVGLVCVDREVIIRVVSACCVAGLLAAGSLEGGVMTPLLVGGAYVAARFRSVPGFLLLEVLAAGLWRLAGVAVALVALVIARPVSVPRFRWFAWAYAVHVALLAALAAW